jgi:hypothetical protein
MIEVRNFKSPLLVIQTSRYALKLEEFKIPSFTEQNEIIINDKLLDSFVLTNDNLFLYITDIDFFDKHLILYGEDYILNQKEHHKVKTFAEEVEEMLNKYNLRNNAEIS